MSSSKKKMDFEIYYKINNLIREHHNNNNAIKKDKTILLYNDGEIVETMGGEKFLKRTMYTKCTSLENVTFKMPIEHGKYSFSILPSIEIAELIRNHMKALPQQL